MVKLIEFLNNIKRNKHNNTFMMIGFVLIILFILQWIFDTYDPNFHDFAHSFLWDDISVKYRIFHNRLFLGDPRDTFGDFFQVVLGCFDRNPYQNSFHSSYPSLVLLIALIISRFLNIDPNLNNIEIIATYKGKIVIILIIFLFIFIMYFLIMKILKSNFIHKRKRIILFLFILISQPLLFSLQRGNFILFAFIFLLGFIAFYGNNNKLLNELSLLFLALAVCCKLYPAVFSILLLKNNEINRREKIKQIFHLTGYIFICFFIPFCFFKGGFSNIGVLLTNIRDFSANSEMTLNYHNQEVLYNFWLTGNLSIGSFTKIIGCIFFNKNIPYFLPMFNSLAIINTLFVIIVLLILLIVIKKKWKVLSIMGISCVLILNNSFFYTLLFMIPGLLYFYIDYSRELVPKFKHVYALCFILMFTPLQFGFLLSPMNMGNLPLFYGYTINSLFQTIACCCFLLLFIFEEVIAFYLKFKLSSKDIIKND
ncbi:MAG: hypothetical protein RSC93_06410 [Erysipelotrichaceae bacterium]